MSTVLKNISFTLDKASINKAIREVTKFQEDLRKACNLLMEKLVDEGAEIARMFVINDPNIPTVGILGSIEGIYFPDRHCGYVMTNEPMAVYVEYGTGAVADANWHPGLASGESEAPIMEYVTAKGEHHYYMMYDTYNHGEEGWWYMGEDGRLVHTKGQAPSPFMYDTYCWLRDGGAEAIAEELLLRKGAFR